jgi:hypothetical protein
MKFEDHCKESFALFGKQYSEVHSWLDEFAGSKEYGMRHRRKRHHLKGIEEARALFGDEAAEAARRHIISDLKDEGWTEKEHFPKDEDDYVRMGLY